MILDKAELEFRLRQCRETADFFRYDCENRPFFRACAVAADEKGERLLAEWEAQR